MQKCELWPLLTAEGMLFPHLLKNGPLHQFLPAPRVDAHGELILQDKSCTALQTLDDSTPTPSIWVVPLRMRKPDVLYTS